MLSSNFVFSDTIFSNKMSTVLFQKFFGENDFKTADKFYKSAAAFSIVTFLLTVADIIAGVISGSIGESSTSSKSATMWNVLGPDLFIAVCSLIDTIITLSAVEKNPGQVKNCTCNNVVTVMVF